MDTVSKEKRSEIMSRVGHRDTSTEKLLRHYLHGSGLRYGIHRGNLPGKPDLVFNKYNAVIFVHGCFWHGHDCGRTKLPKSNVEYWRQKLAKNKERDWKAARHLLDLGWRVLTVWECALQGKKKLPKDTLVNEITAWLRCGEDLKQIQGTDS